MAYGYCDISCDEIFEDDEEDYEYCPYCGKDLDTHNSGCPRMPIPGDSSSVRSFGYQSITGRCFMKCQYCGATLSNDERPS